MTTKTGPGETRRETASPVARPDPIHPKARQVEVIDTDFHFLPHWETLQRYMAEPFRSGYKHYPPVGSDYPPDQAIYKSGTGQSVLGDARTAEDVLRVIDEIGVSKVNISPGFQRPQSMFHPSAITATARAYNDYVATEVLPESDRITAEIMVNQRDPVAGAEEIRRVARNERFASVYTGFGATYESIGTSRHDPIFEAAAEFDLPVTIHIETFWQQWSPLANGARTWTELLGISSMGTAIAFLGSMIMQGVFDKFPTLKVIIKEGGYWWVADFMARGDDFYMGHPGDVKYVERKVESGEKFLHKLPSEYVLDHVRFATQPMCPPADEQQFADLMMLCHGADLFCYSSDWPHATFDPCNWVFEHPKVLSDEVQKKILSGNARQLYKRIG